MKYFKHIFAYLFGLIFLFIVVYGPRDSIQYNNPDDKVRESLLLEAVNSLNFQDIAMLEKNSLKPFSKGGGSNIYAVYDLKDSDYCNAVNVCEKIFRKNGWKIEKKGEREYYYFFAEKNMVRAKVAVNRRNGLKLKIDYSYIDGYLERK